MNMEYNIKIPILVGTCHNLLEFMNGEWKWWPYMKTWKYIHVMWLLGLKNLKEPIAKYVLCFSLNNLLLALFIFLLFLCVRSTICSNITNRCSWFFYEWQNGIPIKNFITCWETKKKTTSWTCSVTKKDEEL